MRKILLGISALVSLTFLAACGGGSAGSSGAAGADGATGSISVFEDADLNMTFNGAAGAVAGLTPTAVPLDSGAVVGKLSGVLAVTGLDNGTANSRNRYYMYAEETAGLRTVLSGATTAEAGGGLYDGFTEDGRIDNRLSNGTAYTNTLTDWVDGGVAGTTYLAKNFQVCPGNEAGDGACASVLAPAYDRGIGTSSSVPNGADNLHTGLTYAGSSFHLIGDNGTSAAAKVVGFRFSAPKTGYASTLTSDNTSTAFHTQSDEDNDTRVSNIITRGTNVWLAMASDNITTFGVEGDNMSLAVRADGTADFTDNGTFATNQLALTTVPQISDAGDGVYVVLGAGAAISGYNIRDNGTNATLTAPATLLVANNWCSTSTGTVGAGVVLISDNGTNGWRSDLLLDNGTTTALSGGVTDDQVASANVGCALTFNGDTFYLAVADVTAATGDNVSVWKSTDAASWTQIGIDFTTTGTVAGLAIGTTGATADDSGVWVAVNDANNVELLHYEDIAGGSTFVWRSLGNIITGASTTALGNGGVSLTTNGSSIIAVSAIVGANPKVNFWYNQ